MVQLNPGTGKKDVHATGAHILIIPQQGGIARSYLSLDWFYALQSA
jgi:hypothetical protein